MRAPSCALYAAPADAPHSAPATLAPAPATPTAAAAATEAPPSIQAPCHAAAAALVALLNSAALPRCRCYWSC